MKRPGSASTPTGPEFQLRPVTIPAKICTSETTRGVDGGKSLNRSGAKMPEDLIPLPDLPRAMRELGTSATYLSAWRAVVAGDIPAQRLGARWCVRKDDLPEIARHLSAR